MVSLWVRLHSYWIHDLGLVSLNQNRPAYVIPGYIDFTILTILQGGVTGHPWCGSGQAGGDGKAGSFEGWPSVLGRLG